MTHGTVLRRQHFDSSKGNHKYMLIINDREHHKFDGDFNKITGAEVGRVGMRSDSGHRNQDNQRGFI